MLLLLHAIIPCLAAYILHLFLLFLALLSLHPFNENVFALAILMQEVEHPVCHIGCDLHNDLVSQDLMSYYFCRIHMECNFKYRLSISTFSIHVSIYVYILSAILKPSFSIKLM